MATKQTQRETLITIIADELRLFPGRNAREIAQATGLRRAIWATLTPTQQERLLRDARRRLTQTHSLGE